MWFGFNSRRQSEETHGNKHSAGKSRNRAESQPLPPTKSLQTCSSLLPGKAATQDIQIWLSLASWVVTDNLAVKKDGPAGGIELFGRDELSPILSFSAASHWIGIHNTNPLDMCNKNDICHHPGTEVLIWQIPTPNWHLPQCTVRVMVTESQRSYSQPSPNISHKSSSVKNYVFLIRVEWWDI